MTRHLVIHVAVAIVLAIVVFLAARAYNRRGFAHRIRGDLDGAIADYTEAIRLNSKYAKAYNNRGVAYRKKGDVENANADLARAKQLPYRP